MNRVKLNALTGMRIVAAGMIVVHHSRALRIPVPNWALDHAVSFFFVLSGFILAYAYPELQNKGEVRNFLVARIARLWPAHAVALLLIIVLLQMPLDRTLVANALLLHAWVPFWPYYFSYNGPSWSISTELFFYLVFPFIIFRWNRSWLLKLISSALLLIAIIFLSNTLKLPDLSQKNQITAASLLYINPLGRLFEFVTGIVAYSVFKQLRPLAQNIDHNVFTVFDVIIITIAGYSIITDASIIFLAPYFQGAGMQWLGHSSDVVIFPFLIIIFAFEAGWLSRLFASAPMILLGEMSFSVYLVHATVFEFYRRHWEVDHTAPDYPGLVICVGATLVLAFVIWAVVETPCRAAAKRWIKERSAFQVQPPIGEQPARVQI